jgi:hypothetical protein
MNAIQATHANRNKRSKLTAALSRVWGVRVAKALKRAMIFWRA